MCYTKTRCLYEVDGSILIRILMEKKRQFKVSARFGSDDPMRVTYSTDDELEKYLEEHYRF